MDLRGGSQSEGVAMSVAATCVTPFLARVWSSTGNETPSSTKDEADERGRGFVGVEATTTAHCDPSFPAVGELTMAILWRSDCCVDLFRGSDLCQRESWRSGRSMDTGKAPQVDSSSGRGAKFVRPRTYIASISRLPFSFWTENLSSCFLDSLLSCFTFFFLCRQSISVLIFSSLLGSV